jgi:hypothetical protein
MPKLYGGKEPGQSFSVSFSRREVDEFRSTWPCCRMPDRAVTFCYDSHGDLVEIMPVSYRYDGEDLLALSHDGNAYAARETGRPELKRGDA